jgi:hypothetical protein
MRHGLLEVVVLAIAIVAISFHPLHANSGIQMLPPTAQGSTPDNSVPCSGFVVGSPSLLGWDGTNPVNCITGVYASPSGSVGIGIPNPSEELEIYGNYNSELSAQVWNGAVGSDVQSRFALATGTPGSYVLSLLADNGGSPYYLLSSGPAVTLGVFQFPTYRFEDTAGNVNLSIAGNGVVSINHALQLANSSGLVGTGCSPVGAIEYDATVDLPVYCSSGTGTWQNMAGLPIVGVLRGCTSYDWNSQNWNVCACDHGYTLIEYPTKNSNVAGHNTAQLAFFGCVLTGYQGGAGIAKASF